MEPLLRARRKIAVLRENWKVRAAKKERSIRKVWDTGKGRTKTQICRNPTFQYIKVMTSTDRKYIREYEWGLLVDIRRLDKEILRRFPFRQHRNAQETWASARQWRDKTHLEIFGMPVTEGFRHVAKRNGSLDTSLPAGISIGYGQPESASTSENSEKSKPWKKPSPSEITSPLKPSKSPQPPLQQRQPQNTAPQRPQNRTPKDLKPAISYPIKYLISRFINVINIITIINL